MPELPEVETMVRGIRSFVEVGRIVEVVRCPCKCRPLSINPKLPAIQRRCEGRTITAARRRAKRIILELSSGDAFVIEPRMTGLMLVSDPPGREHLRYEWRLGESQKPAEKPGKKIRHPSGSAGTAAGWERFGCSIRQELAEVLGLTMISGA